MELMGWVLCDQNLMTLLRTCIAEKTDIPIESLQKYTRQVYSGTISHRLSCPALQRGGMANTNLTFSSWIKIVSDTATMFAKKGENYNICFQSVFLHGIQVLNHHISSNDVVSTRWGLQFCCEGCTWIIGKEIFTMSEVKYNGVPLKRKVNELRPKNQPNRVLSDV